MLPKYHVINRSDQAYPKLLKEIPAPPEKIWIMGEFKKEDEKAIAVVGARRATSYGKEATQDLVIALCGAGLTIVSGLARGVDSVAHKTAIEAGGRTIAVLGSGIDVVYPPENKKLYKDIVDGHGAVISEFEPGTPSNPWNFPKRNRIIAGLSLGVLVTEAAEKSGSLITAGLAGEFGREIFAVPGPIYSKMSAGTAALIKDGAKLVYSAKDVLEELGLSAQPARLFVDGGGFEKASEEIYGKVAPNSSELKMILEFIQDDPKHIDEIIKKTGMSASQVSSHLSLAEIAGVVKHLGSGVYFLKKPHT